MFILKGRNVIYKSFICPCIEFLLKKTHFKGISVYWLKRKPDSVYLGVSFLNPHPSVCWLIFRERERGRNIDWLPSMHMWLGDQISTSVCVWLGLKPTTFWCLGRGSSQWATRPGPSLGFFILFGLLDAWAEFFQYFSLNPMVGNDFLLGYKAVWILQWFLILQRAVQSNHSQIEARWH